MKITLKIASLLTAAALLPGCLFACAKKQEEAKVSVALILTEKSMLNDGTFNQSAYEGIERYAKDNKVTYNAYPPESKADTDYLAAMDAAHQKGAEVIITPGFNFETSVFVAQDRYPDVHFVLIDGSPNNGKSDETRQEKIAPNTYSVFFAEEQAGFLAGYAIVKDGFKDLGFLGGREFPAVVRYGYGFIQGAEYAAREMGLNKGEITVKYDYAGSFEPSPANQAKAASWYNDGAEVIFACGGGMGISVIQAAEMLEDKWVIGVDTDQHGDSDRVITSALKMIANSVDMAIKAHYDGAFPGGKSICLGADVDGVGLTVDTARFKSFTKDDYNSIYDRLYNNTDGITSSIVNDTELKVTALPCEYVKVN
jgi:basic membrane protein A